MMDICGDRPELWEPDFRGRHRLPVLCALGLVENKEEAWLAS